MRSQIPPAALKYFEDRHVDTQREHPLIVATFGPKKGWKPVLQPVRVSHLYLVGLRDNQGVTAVVLSAGDRRPDFGIDELVGKLPALDAEFTDGVPVTEGSGVVAARARVAEVLATIGFTPADADAVLDRADRNLVEFSVDRRDSMTRVWQEGWRYSLRTWSNPDDAPAYELRVLVHEIDEVA